MSAVSPIAAVRVAGIRPAAPEVGSDPSEDGLDVELVTEPVLLQLTTDPVAAAASSADSGHDPARRAFAANALHAPSALGALPPLGVPTGPGRRGPRGNSAVATGFDSRPASNLGDPAHGAFATPFARAMQSFAQR